MAVDAALLDSAVHRGRCTVRIYRWAEPTVSLGYFQRTDDVDPASRWAPLPRVRRLSGGGAILHHHEWTYSCAVPAGHPAIRAPHALYEATHRQIIAVLEDMGVYAALRGDMGIDEAAAAKPFLCFSRGDRRDVVLQGRKIVGSAQRRRKGAVLQHGSILLRASPFAPQIPGIVDLITDFLLSDSVGEQIGRSIASAVGGTIDVAGLTDEEIAAAESLKLR